MITNKLVVKDATQLDAVKSILDRGMEVSQVDLDDLVENINANPEVLNYLTLQDFSTMSKLGIDLSSYVSDVKINNIRAVTFKMVMSNMDRISYQYDVLTQLEKRFYTELVDREMISDQTYLAVIDNLRNSIDSTMNQMLKLADNESIMAMMYVEMGSVKSSLDEVEVETAKRVGVITKTSREKVINLMERLMTEVDSSDESDIVDAEVVGEVEVE